MIQGTISINNRRRVGLIVFGAAIISFVTVMFSTLLIMNAAYGIKPGDPGYGHYSDGTVGGVENTPYQDFLANGCMTEPNTGQEKLVFSTKGLDELGMFWYDPNTCFNIAMTMTDAYTIDSVTEDAEGHMVITLTKK